MATVQRKNLLGPETFGKNHNRGVSGSDTLIPVSANDLNDLPQVIGTNLGKQPGSTCQLPEYRQLSIDTVSRGNEVIELGEHKRRNHEFRAQGLNRSCHYVVGRFGGVEEGEKPTGISDDHRSPNPASISSALSAIGSPE